MTAVPESTRSDLRAALDAARVVFGAPDGATAAALWHAAQQLLQQVSGRPELTGQALVSEVRHLGRITLTDAHALVALSTWADRATGAATNEAERLIVREAWMALDHAAANTSIGIAAPPREPHRHATVEAPRPAPPPVVAPASSHRRRLYAAGIVTLLLGIASLGAVWWVTGRAGRAFTRGVEAYERGAREAARVAFVDAATLDPDDARPLVYLGRISREDGDLPRARRFLTTAVRIAPGSAVATRELASLMLADGQPELARRFYVRALQIDPADRAAQGFLGCALARLQRYDEARRWAERAGPGDWQRCAPAGPQLPPAPNGASGSPTPPHA